MMHVAVNVMKLKHSRVNQTLLYPVALSQVLVIYCKIQAHPGMSLEALG